MDRLLLTTRRKLVSSVAASGVVAALPAQARDVPVPIGTGWRTLPLGCGGLITGFDIADDGAICCRSDVGNCYRWSGTTATVGNPDDYWIPLLTFASLGTGSRLGGNNGGYELVMAPSLSSRMFGIFPDNTGNAKWWVYRSTNAGATWSKTSVQTLNADSNSANGSKNASYKIAVDPNNPDVVYVGMPTNNGNGVSVYRSLDGGIKFSAMGFADTTIIPGVSGIGFDRSSGTVIVGGQKRTARIILPIGGVGIYESTDGGESWKEIATDGIGTTAVSCYQGKFTSTGIYYAILSTGVNLGYLWRYMGGRWTQLDNLSNFPFAPRRAMVPAQFTGSISDGSGGSGTILDVTAVASGALAVGQRIYNGSTFKGTITALKSGSGGAGTYIVSAASSTSSGPMAALNASTGYPGYGIITVDRRAGQDGYLTISGPNGLGVGYTSSNANAGNPSSITWGGATGGQTPSLVIPSYEPGWFKNLPQGRNAFLGGTFTIIDPSGRCWWCGHQSFWYFEAIPNFASSRTTSSVSVGRGMEVTVSQDVCCPHGSIDPVMASQDVGVHRGTFVSYPADSHPVGGRPQCQCIDFAASDSSFIVAKIDKYAPSGAVMLGNSAGLSAYSNNYGAMGSWTVYAVQPDGTYQASVTGDISNGSGGSGTTLNVSVVLKGAVQAGQQVYVGVSSTYKGTILSQLSGTLGGVGSYQLDRASLTTSTTLGCFRNTQGGAIVAVDPDHHIVVPSGFNPTQGFVPVWTGNARSPSQTWAFCKGLPSIQWTRRSHFFGGTAKPFAVGYGSDLGTVWAVACSSSSASTIYKSIDSGATWKTVATLQIGNGGNYIVPYLFAVPGYPGHLWLTCLFTGGGQPMSLWRSTNSGANWSVVTIPASTIPRLFCLGAPRIPGRYPTLFLQLWRGGASEPVLCYSMDEGTNWNVLGPTGTRADMPPLSQLSNPQSIHGCWNVFGRLYACATNTGFSYYNHPS